MSGVTVKGDQHRRGVANIEQAYGGGWRRLCVSYRASSLGESSWILYAEAGERLRFLFLSTRYSQSRI